MELNDAEAIFDLGAFYDDGLCGLQQNNAKAFELWHRAAELGSAEAHYNIGNAYFDGQGVERDMNKAKHYYALAAIGGSVEARHNLGYAEGCAGNMSRAVKHFMIAAGAGEDNSLAHVRVMFMIGHATKEDFEKALRSHKEASDEMKSDQREAATAYCRHQGLISYQVGTLRR